MEVVFGWGFGCPETVEKLTKAQPPSLAVCTDSEPHDLPNETKTRVIFEILHHGSAPQTVLTTCV